LVSASKKKGDVVPHQLQNLALERAPTRLFLRLHCGRFLPKSWTSQPWLSQDRSARLETRKIIERAKGIIQGDLKLSEEEAYLMLQRESRNRGGFMKEIAESIVLRDEIRRPKDKSTSY
jgi:hypothetical protein